MQVISVANDLTQIVDLNHKAYILNNNGIMAETLTKMEWFCKWSTSYQSCKMG